MFKCVTFTWQLSVSLKGVSTRNTKLIPRPALGQYRLRGASFVLPPATSLRFRTIPHAGSKPLHS